MMNRLCIAAIVASILFILVPCGPGAARGADLSEAAGFLSGAVTAFGIHEGGHAAAAALTGTHIRWGVCRDGQLVGFRESRAASRWSGVGLYSAGLVAQEVTSEVILRSHVDRSRPFVRGVMAWNVANPISYAANFWLFSGRGDLSGIANYSGRRTANLVAAGLVAVAVWQGVRFFGDASSLPKWMADGSVNLTASPCADGFSAGLTVAF